MNNTDIPGALVATITQHNAWGKPSTFRVTWIPEEVHYDEALEDSGPTFAFGTEDDMPVQFFRSLVTHKPDWKPLVKQFAGNFVVTVEFREVASLEDLEEGTFHVEQVD